MGAVVEVKYFNSFILSKVVDTTSETSTTAKPVWKYASGVAQPNPKRNWYVEESRIRGGYNNVSMDYGVKAYITENTNEASLLGNSMIYSGIYNSRTDVNETNQFPVGEEITRSLDPSNGSIQKLYAEDTNLIIFQENKVSRALIDKDAIYSAEGSAITTSGAQVIGGAIFETKLDRSHPINFGYKNDKLAMFRNTTLFVEANNNSYDNPQLPNGSRESNNSVVK